MNTLKVEIILRGLELGSLAKAANEYGYSPSAVSQMLESLETELGTTLLRRTHAGVAIAEGNEQIIALMKQQIGITNEIKKAAAARHSGKTTISIATYSSVSKHLLPGAIMEFRTHYPNTNINIVVTDSLIEYYTKGTVDLIFGERLRGSNLVWRKAMTDPYVAVLPETYCCQTDTIAPTELLKNIFAMPKDRNILNYIRKYTSPDTRINTSNDDSAVIELVRVDMCVSILSNLAIRNVSGIQVKPLTQAFTRDLGFMYKEKDYVENKQLKVFIEILEAHAKPSSETQIPRATSFKIE